MLNAPAGYKTMCVCMYVWAGAPSYADIMQKDVRAIRVRE